LPNRRPPGRDIHPVGVVIEDCRVCAAQAVHPAGDHSLVVGEAVEAGVQQEIEPLTLKETGWHYGG